MARSELKGYARSSIIVHVHLLCGSAGFAGIDRTDCRAKRVRIDRGGQERMGEGSPGVTVATRHLQHSRLAPPSASAVPIHHPSSIIHARASRSVTTPPPHLGCPLHATSARFDLRIWLGVRSGDWAAISLARGGLCWGLWTQVSLWAGRIARRLPSQDAPPSSLVDTSTHRTCLLAFGRGLPWPPTFGSPPAHLRQRTFARF